MSIIILLATITWIGWLLYSFRDNHQKAAILAIGIFSQVIGAFLIFQDGIKADEQIQAGSLFGNTLALLLLGTGLTIFTILTITHILDSTSNKKT